MPAVNLFIGGTGVELARNVKTYATFYNVAETPYIFAIDTDPREQDIAQRTLGKELVLAAPGFDKRLKDVIAQRYLQETFADLWEAPAKRKHSFGDPILYSGAEVIAANFESDGGLWTLRGAGWIAFQDISGRNATFVDAIAHALAEVYQSSQGRSAPVLNVIGSLAGGTGSGLFVPLIAAIRKEYARGPLEVHLHVVLPSAFANDWRGHASEDEYVTRGHSGAFAAYREILQLAEEADRHAKPEPRSIAGYSYHGQLINKVFWWGRREVDATSKAADTFHEAGKLVTLLNDRSAANALQGTDAIAGESRRVCGVSTIEFPRLERAQAIAAFAIQHMATQVADAPAAAAESVLALAKSDASTPPLLEFIRDQRSQNQALGSLGGGKFEYKRVADVLLTPLKKIRANVPSEEPLVNEVTHFIGGRALGSIDNYRATEDADWRDYLDRAFARLHELESTTLNEVRSYCQWLPLAAESWVAEATTKLVQQNLDPATGLPSIQKIRQSLIATVEDFDRARRVFLQTPDDTILGGPNDQPFLSGDQLQRKVDQRKVALTEMRYSNPDFKPEPSPHLVHSKGVLAVPLLAAFGFLLASLFSTVPFVASLLGVFASLAARINSLVPRELRVLPNLDVSPWVGLAVSVGLFAFLFIWRQSAATDRPALREREEQELKQDWIALVEFRTLELLWQAAAATCARIAGEASDDEIGRGRVATNSSSLGAPFALLENATRWLGDLARHAEHQKDEATARRPNWITPVGEYRNPDPVQVAAVLPKVRLDAAAPSEANVRRVSDVAITFTTPHNGGSPRLSFLRWKSPRERTTEEEKQHKQVVGSFYAELEKVILPEVSSTGLLKETLNEAMTWDAHRLAKELDTLAERGQERGPAAELTDVAQLSSYLCVPDIETRRRVDDAISLARSDPSLRHAKTLPTGDDIIVSKNVGQSIAYIRLGRFTRTVKLRDIDGQARRQYYGIGHRHGRPKETSQYNACNTEFHLLPELSLAARAECAFGTDRPIAPIVIQRLYGSHHAVATTPSLLEVFYLARIRGYLRWPQQGTEMTCTLDIGAAQVPLLSVLDMGTSDPDDDFGAARHWIAAFDALRTCFTAISLNFGEAPAINQPRSARIRAELWGTEAMREAISVAKRTFITEWRALKGPQGAASRRVTYDAMREQARRDAALMSEVISIDWELATKFVFDNGERILSGPAGVWEVGSAKATPPA